MSEEMKFDEAAFDKAVAKPNGWSGVADPVAEIRRMRDGDGGAFGKDVLRTALALVRAHFDGADDVFLEKSRELAAILDESGRVALASYVRAQTGDEPSWVPMERKRRDEIDAILAEARNKYTVHNCNECDYRKSCDHRFDCDECKTTRKSISLAFGIEDDYFTKLLDQIEAAYKRERTITDIMLAVKDKPLPHPDPDNAPPLFAAPVNAAALRAALKDVLDHAPFATDHATMLTGGNDLLARLRHAYYAPARNCDRFADVLRASEAYEATKTDLPFEEWLFSTEKGKETDNV
jgi:hypothetical protein